MSAVPEGGIDPSDDGSCSHGEVSTSRSSLDNTVPVLAMVWCLWTSIGRADNPVEVPEGQIPMLIS